MLTFFKTYKIYFYVAIIILSLLTCIYIMHLKNTIKDQDIKINELTVKNETMQRDKNASDILNSSINNILSKNQQKLDEQNNLINKYEAEMKNEKRDNCNITINDINKLQSIK